MQRVVDPHHPRIGRQIGVEGARRRYLGDDADIGEGRQVAMGEAAAFPVVGEQALHRRQPGPDPMPDPAR